MAQHARLANDRAWLAAHKKAVLDGCQWIVRERNFSKEKANNPCRGLLYGKFVCDMPGGEGYFAYADAVSYMGLRQMARLLSDWGYAEGRGLLDEAESYRQDIVAAVNRLTDKSRDPWYVPWDLSAPKAKNEYLNGACGPINLAFGGVLPRDNPLIAQVIRWNIDHVHKGSREESATASMFYSQDLAIVLLEEGRVEDFLRMFYTILAADVTHGTLATGEWGIQHAAARPFDRQPDPDVSHDDGPGAGRRTVSPARDPAALAGRQAGDYHHGAAHLVRAAFARLRFAGRQRQRAPEASSAPAPRRNSHSPQAAAAGGTAPEWRHR